MHCCVSVFRSLDTKCDVLFFYKQKTAYEMRISDWSSDVCSSDLSCRSSRSMTFETADGVVPLYRAAALNEPASTARTNAKMPVERYASFIGSRASTCAIAFASAERPGRGRVRPGSDADRKSDGEGMRGEVRVDRRVGRRNKKKK